MLFKSGSAFGLVFPFLRNSTKSNPKKSKFLDENINYKKLEGGLLVVATVDNRRVQDAESGQ